jgi:signal transduction histidine kinase
VYRSGWCVPPLMGDRDKLTQVMLNLLSNAVKYAPDGGVILISSDVDGQMVHIQVQVQDQGVGLPCLLRKWPNDKSQRAAPCPSPAARYEAAARG